MLLLDFVRLGEQAWSLISEAQHLVGLNQTQAMICWQLAQHPAAYVDGAQGITLTQLSLTLRIPRTRLHNQLSALTSLGLIKLIENPSVQDRRKKFYALTALGLRKTRAFLAAVKKLDDQLQEVLIPMRIKDKRRWRMIRDQFISASLKL